MLVAENESATPSGAGFGDLDFEKVGERTVLRKVFARNPLRLLTPRNLGAAAWVYSSSYGGGLVGGDHLDIRLRVRSKAMAVILSQSTTKIYRSPLGCSQSINGHVEEQGFLAMIPDPVSCFSGSSFAQKQNYRLDDGASLLLVDTLNCGRSAAGERWLFDRFQSQIRVSRREQPIFFESLLLDSRAGNLARRNGRFNTHCLFMMTGPALLGPGAAILETLAATRVSARADLVCSASRLSDGLRDSESMMVRMAAVSTEELARALRGYLDFLPGLLGDDPWARKW